MVGYAGSPTRHVYVDLTLTRSEVKVTGLLNFRQLAKLCMLAAMTAAPLAGLSGFEAVFLTNFWATICKTVRPMLSDHCPSVSL